MKFSRLIFLWGLLLPSVAHAQSDYALEDRFYACMESGIHKSQLEPVEDWLLAAELLTDTSGEAYYTLLTTIADTGTLPEPTVAVDRSVLRQELSLDLDLSHCQSILEALPQSHRYRKLFDAIDSIIARESISHQSMASVFKKQLSTRDLEHPLYVCLALIQLRIWYQEPIGILMQLPVSAPGDSLLQIPDSFVFTLVINSQDALLVEGSPASLEYLGEQLEAFLQDPLTKRIVSVKAYRGTSYAKYIAVLDVVDAAYDRLREEKAQAQYGKSYEALSAPQQQAIRREIPKQVSIAEPTDIE